MTHDVTEQLAEDTGHAAVLGRVALASTMTAAGLMLIIVMLLVTDREVTHYMGVKMAGTSEAGVIGEEIIAHLIEPTLTHFINYTFRTIDHHYMAVERVMHPTVSAHFQAWSEIERAYVKTSAISSNGSIRRIHVERDQPVSGLFHVKADAEREVLVGASSSAPHPVTLTLTVKPQQVGDTMLLYVIGYEVPQHSDARPYREGDRF